MKEMHAEESPWASAGVCMIQMLIITSANNF
jgi:hypothetical protein